MSTFDNLVKRLGSRHQPHLNKICEPILNYLGAKFFTYHRIDNVGNYTCAVNDIDWAEHYVSQRYYEIDPFLRQTTNYQTGILFYDTIPNDYYRGLIYDAHEKFDMAQGFLYMDKQPDYCEFFGFGATARNTGFKNICVNELPQIKQFIRYFKNESSAILADMTDCQIDLSQLNGYTKDDFQLVTPGSDERQQFLEKIGKGYQFDFAVLSPREKECVRWLLRGKSASETAATLGLSRRTVEHYFESIKTKLNCARKSDIIAKISFELDNLF